MKKSGRETFSVAWDFSAIDQTTPGEYTAAGRIKLPEGYAFGEAVLQELQISVRVEEMPPAVITSIEQWYPYTDAFAVQQGSETETLENLFAFSPYYLECYAKNGTSYTAVVEWDFSGIDLNTVGLYHAAGRLTAPENTIFADRVDFPEISIPVSVQAPGSPRHQLLPGSQRKPLFSLGHTAGESGQGQYMAVQKQRFMEPSGKWRLCRSGNALDCHPSAGTGQRLPPQVDYDGGQTGILVLYLRR